jgi:outer membrane PBP1 activator LpoA protein
MLAATALRAFARSLARSALAACVAAGALSCAQAPRTMPAPVIERQAIPGTPAAAPSPTAAVPPSEAGSDVELAQLTPPPAIEAAPPPVTPIEARSSRPAAAKTDLVALILPLDAPAYARAAEAVRDGFLAAAEVAGARSKCIVLAHKEEGVLAAFDEARDRGVRVVVGPLLRDDLKALAIAEPDMPWTIALNQLDDRSALPPALFTFALTIESDARVLARRAHQDGMRKIDVISAEPAIMKRLATAFTGEWISGGGGPPADFRFDSAPEALTLLRRNLARTQPDAVLLAVDGHQAALVKSFVGTIPAYASGLVFERPDAAVIRDLNDVTIVEIPWLVTPDAPQIAAYPRRDSGSAALDRLYALGIDAFRVAQAFGDDPPRHFELDGATGYITLNASRQFVREGRLAVFRDGRLVLLDAAAR